MLFSWSTNEGLSRCKYSTLSLPLCKTRINNLDMTKWKQPFNGITAVMVPSGSFRALPPHLLSGGVSSPPWLSDRLMRFSPWNSIATLNWSSRLCSGASRAISTAGRRRRALCHPATPATTSPCARASSAPTQVPAAPLPLFILDTCTAFRTSWFTTTLKI